MLKCKGGYVLIDCKKMDLTKGSTEQTITGIYDRVKEAMNGGKPVYACNCVWGTGNPVTPINVIAIQEDTDTIICTASTLQIVVKNTDKVTIVNMVESEDNT